MIFCQMLFTTVISNENCVKSVNIWSYYGPYFCAFGLNTDQNNSEYGQLSHVLFIYLFINFILIWRKLNPSSYLHEET